MGANTGKPPKSNATGTILANAVAGGPASPVMPAAEQRSLVPLLALWWPATARDTGGSIPSPAQICVALRDLAFGGVDVAFGLLLLCGLPASAGWIRVVFPLAATLAFLLPYPRDVLSPAFNEIRRHFGSHLRAGPLGTAA